MIKVDENDPVGEVDISFPYRDVQIKRGIDPKTIYELESEIGRGKFGTVYKCKEKSTGLNLAAKFIGVPKKEDRRNVEREVEIMRQLQHPRLIQLYDAFENGKIMCVILELIDGGELFERVIDDDFILTEKSCTVFMRQICEGVDFIHKQNILHLDMKPENILCLTKTGNRIKIIDFGLARKFDPEKKLQVLFGTPEFVAPEVVNFDKIGFGTDMWSVGVICYVLLSGLSPFMGSTDIETMANVTVAKYDFDDDAFQEISDSAKDFIAKLLIKDLNLRLSAEQCLKHAWLRRRDPPKIPKPPSMDMTKDNLRQFVERWSEHPNSPYVFELTSHAISPCGAGIRLSESLNSLVVSSPSPCESLASSAGSDDAFLTPEYTNGNYLSPHVDHIRRASDSSCVVKGTDISERLNLAEEIRKLSDKLFRLSTIPTALINDEPVIFDSAKFKSTALRTGNSDHSITCKIEQSDSKENNALPAADPPDNANGKIPWRKTKFRINSMSRDVPILPKRSSNSFREQFNSRLSTFKASEINHGHLEDSTDTKDLLLQLLGQWDGPKGPKVRHSSISAELTEDLGQRTISSLNTFFQSRATHKKFISNKKT